MGYIHDYMNDDFCKFIEAYRLKEKIFNIDKDVNYIYDKAFKKIIDDFNNHQIIPEIKEYTRIQSSELKTEECKEAHDKYSIEIICGSFKENSKAYFYKGQERIVISIHASFIRKLQFFPIDGMSIENKKIFQNELSEHRIKASIYHELSHWISDANYKSYLHVLIAKTRKISILDPDRDKKVKKIMYLGKPNVNMTHYEIDAQIHAIKQIKSSHKKDWGSLTLSDLFFKYSPLNGVAQELYNMGEDIYKAWVKDLIKRMNREGLLGSNMKKIPNFKKIIEAKFEEMCCV